MFIPATRTYALLILGAAIAIPVFIGNQFLGITGLILFDAVVLVLAFWDGFRMKSERIEVQRQLAQKLSIGRENLVTLDLSGVNRATVAQIYDAYPQSMKGTEMPLRVQLTPEQSHRVNYSVWPDQRGEFEWKYSQVRLLSPWKLAWHDWKIPQAKTVQVYPDLIGLRSLTIRLTLESSGNMRRARRMGIGTEFSELREYDLGDDPRFIDWKATARRGRPFVKVLEPEQEQTLIILLDRGRLMTAQVSGLSRFDWGLNATLSLALAGLHRGDRVGVGIFDRQLHTWIPPERGQNHLNTILSKLTPIQPDFLEPDYLNAVTQIAQQQTRRALVVIITDVVDRTASAELLGALGQLTPRYLPFCVTLRDPEVNRTAHEITTDVSATYVRAVALDLLSQRQVVFESLRQKGVMVLDAPANQVTEELVDSYLQLKAKNRI